ncbi:MAG: Fur family transcriptional regulator [Prevotella sp.]
MEAKTAENILAARGIRPTVNRILTLKSLTDAGRPLSLSELEERMLTVDKSGIFRALTLFRERHLVHVIEGGDEGVRYEPCTSHDEDEDNDRHVHFYCERCHRTLCIDNVPVPEVCLPDGYTLTSANYMMRGICPDCKR